MEMEIWLDNCVSFKRKWQEPLPMITPIGLIAKKRSDYIKPKPNPSSYYTLTPVMETDGTTPKSKFKLICFDPVLKDQMDAEYNMDLNIQSSNWNQYNRMEEGYYRTAIEI
jgi:hypothetical protein